MSWILFYLDKWVFIIKQINGRVKDSKSMEAVAFNEWLWLCRKIQILRVWRIIIFLPFLKEPPVLKGITFFLLFVWILFLLKKRYCFSVLHNHLKKWKIQFNQCCWLQKIKCTEINLTSHKSTSYLYLTCIISTKWFQKNNVLNYVHVY